MTLKNSSIDYLFSTGAIRDQALSVFEATIRDQTHFKFYPEKLKETVSYVLTVIKKHYPELKIPFHSRWGHFKAGGIDRVQWLNEKLTALDAVERARVKIDLIITSVLLDAGAGSQWKYFEEKTSQSYSRSEGLGVASFHLFLQGGLSSDGQTPQANQKGLELIQPQALSKAFQVTEDNPLIGVEGRTLLLNRLAKALENKLYFQDGRPGNLVDYFQSRFKKILPAPEILKAVLESLGSIWPGRLSLDGVNLGDVWSHSKLGLIPFHKLSQWMTYSLIEPLVEAGFEVTEVENLTGLAEYRNGGLMVDSGLILAKESSDLEKAWGPESDIVIEWRALTIYLLDEIGIRVQRELGFTPEEFPLAKVLEGGTWWAGRYLAQEKRKEGTPPLHILSDGTVF